MVVIIKGRFLAANNNATFPMLFNLLLSDSLHLSFILFYLIPAAIVQDVMVVGLDTTLGTAMRVVLYVSRTMLACLACSRLVLVCYPKFSGLFERSKVIKMCIVTWPLCIALAVIGQYLMPCCQLVLYFRTFSLHFSKGADSTNYSDFLIEKPTSIGSSLIAFVCYSIIIIKIRKERKQVLSALTNLEQNKRKKQEYGFAFQFTAISICSTFTWLSYLIYPKIIPHDQPECTFVLDASNTSVT
uniref:G-protein coupled receptors family 1 profile domain-containing protein n=1 Tax=Plectus sambesii TaxID=2011161 RepID=A0A914UYP8_9BILA